MKIDKYTNDENLTEKEHWYEYKEKLITKILVIDLDKPIYFTKSLKVGESLEVGGIKTSYYIQITCLKWNIYIMENHIRIGCELHTKDDWKNYTDNEIKKMNPRALEFWEKHKSWILNINPDKQ